MSRRTEILRRAAEVFERQGVTHTSLEDIAKAVGIKREGIYYYFQSRAEILVKLILPQSQSMLRALEAIVNSHMTSPEKLHAAIRNHLDKFNPNYLEMSVALREDHFYNPDENLIELKRVWREYGAVWTRLIAEGQQKGDFRSGPDSKMLAYGILGMCNWMSRWYDPSKSVAIGEIIDIFYGLASQGVLDSAAAERLSAKA